jgi:hypothetical protein
MRASDQPLGRLAFLMRYLSQLTAGKIALWCYLLWYLVTVVAHFDPSPSLWLTSVGLSAIVGCGLLLSVHNRASEPLGRWQTFRLFLMPFCVSSFAALIKGQGYVLVFPSRLSELFLSISLCSLFVLIVLGLKTMRSIGRA